MFGKTFFNGGESLQLSLPVEMSDEFDRWIEQDIIEMKELAEQFTEKVKQYGELCDNKFGELEKVKFIVEKIQFFVTHKLHD